MEKTRKHRKGVYETHGTSNICIIEVTDGSDIWRDEGLVFFQTAEILQFTDLRITTELMQN